MVQNMVKKVEPNISVILPAYNAERFLKEAIDSILAQTYTNFELIILNDGSTDRTEEIILSYKDPRIRYVKNETNLKLIKTLNKGIDLAKGKYIARMDADDISLPMRLEKEYEFMERHPDAGACSSKVYLLKRGKIIKGHYYPCTSPAACRFCSVFRTPLSHPSSFFRTDILKSLKYDEDESALHIEAFVLWGNMALKNISMYVLNDRLLYYRDNDQSVCHTYTDVQLYNHKVRVKYMFKNLLDLSVNDKDLDVLYDNKSRYSVGDIKHAISIVDLAYSKYISVNNISVSVVKDIKNAKYAIKRNVIANLLREASGLKKIQIAFLLMLIILKIK